MQNDVVISREVHFSKGIFSLLTNSSHAALTINLFDALGNVPDCLSPHLCLSNHIRRSGVRNTPLFHYSIIRLVHPRPNICSASPIVDISWTRKHNLWTA
ncbi:hypothetical protein ECG_02348 [Echinococcus granulosus]|nr:hypothetical protein ECG_02348 [Echinococcus granulosus]